MPTSLFHMLFPFPCSPEYHFNSMHNYPSHETCDRVCGRDFLGADLDTPVDLITFPYAIHRVHSTQYLFSILIPGVCVKAPRFRQSSRTEKILIPGSDWAGSVADAAQDTGCETINFSDIRLGHQFFLL